VTLVFEKAALGHEDQFPPRRPNARFVIGKEAFRPDARNG